MRVKKNELILLLIIPCLIPLPFTYKTGSWIMTVPATKIAFMILMLIFIYYKGYHTRLKLLFLFSLYLLFCTVIAEGSFDKYYEYIINLLSPALWVECCLLSGLSYKKILKFVANYFKLILLCNFLFLLFVPEFWGTHIDGGILYLISNRNSLLPYLLPAWAIIIANNIILKRKKISSLSNSIWYIICLVTVILSNTGTGILVLGVLGVIIYFPPLFKYLSKKISLKEIIIGCAIIMVLIIHFKIQEYFAFLFTDLGRDITFTGRIFLWEKALNQISKSVLIGYGVLENELIFTLNNPDVTFTSHNMYFQMLLWGGIPLLCMYILDCFNIAKVQKWITNDIVNRCCTVMNCAFFGVSVYYIFEMHNNAPVFFLLLNLMRHIDSIDLEKLTK